MVGVDSGRGQARVQCFRMRGKPMRCTLCYQDEVGIFSQRIYLRVHQFLDNQFIFVKGLVGGSEGIIHLRLETGKILIRKRITRSTQHVRTQFSDRKTGVRMHLKFMQTYIHIQIHCRGIAGGQVVQRDVVTFSISKHCMFLAILSPSPKHCTRLVILSPYHLLSSFPPLLPSFISLIVLSLEVHLQFFHKRSRTDKTSIQLQEPYLHGSASYDRIHFVFLSLPASFPVPLPYSQLMFSKPHQRLLFFFVFAKNITHKCSALFGICSRSTGAGTSRPLVYFYTSTFSWYLMFC